MEYAGTAAIPGQICNVFDDLEKEFIVKNFLLSAALALLAFTLGAQGAYAQGCTVTVSIATSATASGNCYVPPGQSFTYGLSGTWAGTVEIDNSFNNGLSWTPIVTTTTNIASTVSPQNTGLMYRAYFTTRTSGTVTGNLLGLSPILGASIYSTIPIGDTAYGSLGTGTIATVAGTIYESSVEINRAMTVTDIFVLNGATVTTDKVVYALFDGSGRLLANTAVAGVLTAGVNAFQDIALVTPVAVPPGLYYIGVQSNGTTDKQRWQATATFVKPFTSSITGVFGTIPFSITPPSAFAANVGPIAYVKGY